MAKIFQIPIQRRCDRNAVVAAQNNFSSAAFNLKHVPLVLRGNGFDDEFINLFGQQTFDQSARSCLRGCRCGLSRQQVDGQKQREQQGDFTHGCAQKNGLCAFSSATVVSGPCPGQINVSGGSVRIWSRTFCFANSPFCPAPPMEPAKIVSPTIAAGGASSDQLPTT